MVNYDGVLVPERELTKRVTLELKNEKAKGKKVYLSPNLILHP